jgi:hypothetical protein
MPHHHTRTLAGTTHCNVLQCSCGMLHVTVGPVTLRVEPGTARTLRDVLDAALAVIADDAARDDKAGQLEAGERETAARHEASDAARGGPRLRLASSRGDELPS